MRQVVRNTRIATWVLLVVLLGLSAIAAIYGAVAYRTAKHQDTVSRLLASHLAQKLPTLTVRSSPTENVSSAIVIAAGNSSDACSYWTLSRCVGLKVDSRIGEDPRLLLALISELRAVCRGFESDASVQSSVLASFFSCKSTEKLTVDIHVEVIQGLGLPAKEVPLGNGAVTYARPRRDVLYRLIVSHGA